MKCSICGKEHMTNENMLHLIDLRLAALEALVLKQIDEDEWYNRFHAILIECEKLKKC